MTSLRRMRIAYLIGHYPAVTHTFIQREIEQIRRQGFEIETFSVWRATEDQLAHAASTATSMPEPITCCRRGPADYLRSHVRSAFRAPRRLRQDPESGDALVRSWAARTAARSVLVPRGRGGAAQVPAAADPARSRPPRRHGAGRGPARYAISATAAADTGPWSFSMTVHGSKEFFDVARQGLARKVRAARFVVCVSDFTRSQLMALVDDAHWSKLHVVHCGIDPEQFAPPQNASSCRRPGTHPHGWSSGQHEGRRHPDRGDGRATPPRRACGTDRRGRRPAARASAAACSTRFGSASTSPGPGPVGQDGIRAHYHAAHVFCLPSFAEGIPVVLMEAMSTALPSSPTRSRAFPNWWSRR